MARRKRKLTAAQKAAKRRRKREYETVFLDGKQKRIKRPPTIDAMDVDEFIRRNADPIWLQQNEMWEYMAPQECQVNQTPTRDTDLPVNDDDQIPF